jgi:hypothetical protein
VPSATRAEYRSGGVSVRKDDLLGLTLEPADDTLRSQLKLDKVGLVVTDVAHGSSGDAGGVQAKDILVAVADKPVASPEDVRVAVAVVGGDEKEKPKAKAEGEEKPQKPGAGPARIEVRPLRLKVIRAGQPREMRVPPPSEVRTIVVRLPQQAEAKPQAPSYWIGVSMGEVDDTLRSHLKLGEGVGLVVTDVFKGSPAERAGLATNDVIEAIDGQPVKAPDDMVKAVQASKGEATLKLKTLRAGDPREVSVKPELRKEEPKPAATEVREVKVDRTSPTWVAQVLPFLDKDTVYAWTAPKGQFQTFHNWSATQPHNQFFLYGNAVPPPQALGQHYIARWNAAAAAGPKPPAGAERKAEDLDQKKLAEATRQLTAEAEKLIAQVRAQDARQKAVFEFVRKAPMPADALSKIDAQLKALEAQVGEIKRTVEELKGSIGKDPKRPEEGLRGAIDKDAKRSPEELRGAAVRDAKQAIEDLRESIRLDRRPSLEELTESIRKDRKQSLEELTGSIRRDEDY